ncbi:MAG: RHS repeat-associated core domain-containing protein, partial [Gammaproteobacteria bacterium]
VQDADSGMVYAGARYYDPLIGRFMAVDPVGFKVSDPMTFNRYSYGNNNPYKYVDPDGKEVFQIDIQVSAPKVAGILAHILKPEVETTGLSFGLAFSAPDTEGRGEYDVGLFSTLELDSQGLSTGKLALGYSESLESSDSVKDIAGVEGSASMDFAVGGPDVSYSESGIESVGLHIGVGVGGSVSANATSVISLRHQTIFGFDDVGSTRPTNSRAK